ncbi:MAG: histidine kinase [Tannerellaceae bacterium]|nr:histidine kinase [Tannerellaceae bacterium]
MNENIEGKVFRHPRVALFGKREAFHASVFTSLIINMVLIVGVLYGHSHQIAVSWADYILFFFWHVASNLLLFYPLFLFNFRMIKKGRGKRYIYQTFLGTILLCLLISSLISRFQWGILEAKMELNFGEFAVLNMVKNLILSIIVITITYILYLYTKREQTLITNHNLIQENIRIKYESLKNQLDPHFLFNSLNTLSGLVGMDDEKAQDYIDNLSAVFRYTLHSKNVCKLEKELAYVDAYFSLMKIRYGDNLQLTCNIQPEYYDYLVIPVSIQLLVENAIKHNIISNSAPLQITIETSAGASVTVKNPIRPKINKSIGGVGLVNLTERYAILFGKTIEIKEQNGEFSVTIPLIERSSQKILNS